jgi:periplasmic protein TonB
MKNLSLSLFLALALPCFAQQAPTQDKPQVDPPLSAAKRITRIRQGGNLAEKRLIHKVDPEYPQGANGKRLSGTVRLHVLITNDGSVGQLEVISGDSVLARAALDAVRQWKYRPVVLNGDPVEVDTTIDVVFRHFF